MPNKKLMRFSLLLKKESEGKTLGLFALFQELERLGATEAEVDTCARLLPGRAYTPRDRAYTVTRLES